MNKKKLYLSDTDKMIAGVCGGIAEYFGMDSTLVRVLFVIVSLLSGVGAVAYIICWLVIPHRTIRPEDVVYTTFEEKDTNDGGKTE